MSEVIAPHGTVRVFVPDGESIAVYAPESAQVFEVTKALNYPPAERLIGTVIDQETLFGPFTNGAEIVIKSNSGVNCGYDVGLQPFVRPMPNVTGVDVVTVAATSYTVSPSDWGKQIETTSGSAVSITIDSSSLEDVLPSALIAITQAGAGTVSVSGSGVTVRSTAVFAQYVTNGFQLKANDEVWSL